MAVPITPAMVAAALEASKKSAIEKVHRLYAAELDFHTAALESIRLAKDAVTVFMIEELRGKLNALVEQNQFSIGKFLVTNAARNQLRNISRMLALLLFKGDP